eukprot:2971713-Rhodomonas_salina.1
MRSQNSTGRGELYRRERRRSAGAGNTFPARANQFAFGSQINSHLGSKCGGETAALVGARRERKREKKKDRKNGG